MSRLMKFFVGAAAVTVMTSSVLLAQVSVTLHLRSGEALAATLVDLGGGGFEVRVGGDTRTIPKDQVAWVDFGGNVNVAASALDGLSGGAHLVVMKNGDTMLANWDDVGGTTPLRLSFKTSTGDRDLTSNEVARIYLTRPGSGTGGSPANPSQPGLQPDGSVAVMANQAWTDTGINVRSGEMLRFTVTRTIRLGSGTDETTADGNTSVPTRAGLRSVPVRSMPAGGLIGRVGDGPAFAIGTAPQLIRMPANGRLRLGINDLTFEDNSGHFRVVIGR